MTWALPVFEPADSITSGINSALRKPFHVIELACLGVEHFYEGIADNFALRLGVFDTGELAEEEVFGVGTNDLHTPCSWRRLPSPARPR